MSKSNDKREENRRAVIAHEIENEQERGTGEKVRDVNHGVAVVTNTGDQKPQAVPDNDGDEYRENEKRKRKHGIFYRLSK